MDIRELHRRLERDYETTAPQVTRVRALLHERGEEVVNDHIALRTYSLPALGLERLIKPFTERGYRLHSHYRFSEKSLRAVSLEHDDQELPLVFASELLVDELPLAAQAIVHQLVSTAPATWMSRDRLEPRDVAADVSQTAASALDELVAHPTWRLVTRADYLKLREASEYAAWVAAFGIRVNHITVSCNRLHSFADMEALCDWLRSQEFVLNGEPGAILGSPAHLLEQCSTIAEEIPWTFTDGDLRIPGSYVEFAKRYLNPASGSLYRGFLEASADKIFESTNASTGAS